MDCRFAVPALVAFLIPSVASGGSSPRDTLEEFFRRATTIVSNTNDPQRAGNELRAIIGAVFEGDRAARRALGPEWEHRTPPEREKFARLFAGALQKAYLQIVAARLPRDRIPAVHFTGKELTGERFAVVRTSVRARDGNDVSLDYVMARTGGNWLVHDVVIDGVSLVENYAAQFAHILRTSSYEHLLARLEVVAGLGHPNLPALGMAARGEEVVAYFKASRSDLSAVARRELETTADWLLVNGASRVVIEGHSDERDDARLNRVLAQRRANAVRDHLVRRGIADNRITTVAYGDQRPLSTRAEETCCTQNRRAVLRVTPSSVTINSQRMGRPGP